jgi:hypothetical protein
VDEREKLNSIDAFLRIQTPYLQGSITHADQKAAFLLVVVGGTFGFLQSQQALSRWWNAMSNPTGPRSAADWLLLAALVLLGLALWAAVMVVRPRYWKKAEPLVSWAPIPGAFKDPKDYAAKVLSQESTELFAAQLRHHHYRAKVCKTKWQWLKAAYYAGALGILLTVAYLSLVPPFPGN